MQQLSFHDESALTWFYGYGQTAFEHSTMGAMLHGAELFASAGELVWSERADEYLLEQHPTRRSAPPPWPTLEHGAIVYSERELTARPTIKTRSCSGSVPDGAAMELFAVVSGALKALERRSPIACAVLEAFYGDLGCDWARTPKPGRMGALYHLTEAGVRLLAGSAAEARKAGQPFAGLSAARRMQNECAPTTKKIERRRVGLMRADRQAIGLRAEAADGWCAVQAELQARRAA